MASNYVTIDLEQERMQTAFKVIDKNGDGKISLQEFKTVMMFNDMFTKEEVNRLFKEVDSDDKGYIDYKGKCRIPKTGTTRAISIIKVSIGSLNQEDYIDWSGCLNQNDYKGVSGR